MPLDNLPSNSFRSELPKVVFNCNRILSSHADMTKQERNNNRTVCIHHCNSHATVPNRADSGTKNGSFCWRLQGPGRRLSTSDSGVDMSVSPHSRSLPTPHVASSHQLQPPPRHPDAYAEDDPNLYRGEIDGLMQQHNYQRQRPIYAVSGPVPSIGSAWIERAVTLGARETWKLNVQQVYTLYELPSALERTVTIFLRRRGSRGSLDDQLRGKILWMLSNGSREISVSTFSWSLLHVSLETGSALAIW